MNAKSAAVRKGANVVQAANAVVKTANAAATALALTATVKKVAAAVLVGNAPARTANAHAALTTAALLK